MNHKEMVLAALRGESVPGIPYVPRLDIWYKANKYNGTLPVKYRNAGLIDIVDDLGIGFHAVVPDFRDFDTGDGDIDLGLGIHRFRAAPYKSLLHNVERKVTKKGGVTAVEYTTPHGKISTKVLYDENMRRSGSTLAHTLEYPVKGANDFKALGYIFKNIEVVPEYGGYSAYKEYIGGRGAVVAFNSLCASPMHYILKELMPADEFFYASYDYPDELEQLAADIAAYYHRAFKTAADCPCEIVLSGANYDSAITPPPFFEKYIMNELRAQADILHKQNKLLLTHTDGENRGLLGHYLNSGFDIADSICPAPMTSMGLREIREAFGGKIAVWGGIPSVCVLQESMSDYEFEKYINAMMENTGGGVRLVFSIADTTPPGAKFERIVKLNKIIESFGPVK